jgi:glycosyltransferase involved in cell wall biosynthesis
MSAVPRTVKIPVISIIVPVYNVGSYLREGLESLLAQNFAHPFEVILIDDCSTDDSLAICREFAGEYPHRFQLIESAANVGVSAARNIGLDNASGDYFMFLDPDDTLPAGALHDLKSAATLHDADIVKGNNTIFSERGEFNARYNVSSDALVTGDGVLTTLYDHSRVRGHPWGKLFNRSRLGHIRFPVGVRMAQDLYYCGEVFSVAQSLLLINKSVYRYRHRDTGSTGRKYETGAYLDWLDSVEKIGNFAASQQQRNAHRDLQVRTMTQIARECRKIPAELAARVLATIDQKANAWNIRLSALIKAGGPGLHTLGRYFKFQLALRQIRRKLARP